MYYNRFHVINKLRNNHIFLWHSYYSVQTSQRLALFHTKKNSILKLQWNSIKNKYPSHVIFFRFGSFYELLNQDAVIASEILNIRLNKLGRAGFPYHSITNFVPKLVRAGYSIALVEETKIVKHKDKKASFRDREVIALLSPSTYPLFIDQDEDTGDTNTYNQCIVSITNQQNMYTDWTSLFDSNDLAKFNTIRDENNTEYLGLCIMDINIGKIEISHSTNNNLVHDLSRINPAEVFLCTRTAQQMPDVVDKLKELFHVTLSDEVLTNDAELSPEAAVPYDEVIEYINWNKSTKVSGQGLPDTKCIDKNIKHLIQSHLHEFASKLQLSATVLLMLYLKECKVNIGKESINSFNKYNRSDILFMDASTRRALEITHSMYDHNHVQSLNHCLNKANTPMGRRLLKQRLSSPITDVLHIEKRLDCIEYFRKNATVREYLIEKLKLIGDFQKNYQNILLRSTYCDMETLQLLAHDILLIESIYSMIAQHTIDSKHLIVIAPVCDELMEWANAVIHITDSEQKIKLKALLSSSSIRCEGARSIVTELREKTGLGIRQMKLDNKVEMYGYCICIPPKYCNNDAIAFAHKYDLHLLSSNKALYRFKTDALSAMEIQHSEIKLLLSEYERNIAIKYISDLYQISHHLYDMALVLSEFDIASSFANLSLDRNYVRPQFAESDAVDGECLEIIGGRHPVIESINNEISFHANDCVMSAQTNNMLYLITGANMSGKSTYLRQCALLIIMAQSGLYVPCGAMKLSLFDAIFVRFGSNDALFRDQSTFMVEMNESADILKYATSKSLIIMDEIAKSTSPSEGFCIARAMIKYIHSKIKCRCLFSTHFYKCVQLETKLEHLKCYYMLSNANANRIQFMHKLAEGSSHHSHAIYIAKIAGIPHKILKDAKKTFAKLSKAKDTIY